MDSKLDIVLEKLEQLQVQMDILRQEVAELKTNKQHQKKESSGPLEGEIKFSLYKKGAKVSGETKPYKDIIKSLGGKWNGGLKCWIMTVENAKKAYQACHAINPEEVVSELENQE